MGRSWLKVQNLAIEGLWFRKEATYRTSETNLRGAFIWSPSDLKVGVVRFTHWPKYPYHTGIQLRYQHLTGSSEKEFLAHAQ